MAAHEREGTTKSSQPWATDIEYVQDEIGWIEARCRRLAFEARANAQLTRRSARGPHQTEPVPSPERIDAAVRRERALRDAIDARLEAHRASGRQISLDRLCRAHELDAFERTVLLLAAAPCIARRFEDLYAQLDSESAPGLTVDAIFAFCELSFAERVVRRAEFGPTGRLVADDLVDVEHHRRFPSPKALLGTEVELRGRTLSLMLGDHGLGEELAALASVEVPRATFDRVVLAERQKRRILGIVEAHERYLVTRRAWGIDDVIAYGRGALMLFHGSPGTGKTMAAHAVAERMGKRVMNVDVPTFLEHHEAGRFVPGLFREARLHDAILFFDECEALFESRRNGNALMTVLLTELERFEGVAILATNLPQVLDEALDRRILLRVRFPEPDREAREAIWRGLLPPAVPLAGDVDLSRLAARYEMSGGYIKNAVLLAVAGAVHEAGELEPRLTHATLEAAAAEQCGREAGAGDLDGSAAVPRARLEDIALAQDARSVLEEIVAVARGRREVIERWALGAHLPVDKSLSVLVTGEPGTGKTLCGEVIAGELHRPLIVVSVPALVGRPPGYDDILAQLFGRARRLGAVLFFDDADACFGGPPFGLADVILGQAERHAGLVLFAAGPGTEPRAALAHRFCYRIRLLSPGPAERTAIWRAMLRGEVPIEGTLDLETLAERYPLDGRRITRAVLRAASLAASSGRALTQNDLLRVAREETGGAAGTPRTVGFGPPRLQ